MHMTFNPIWPWPAVLAAALVLFLLLGYGSLILRQKGIPVRWVTLLAVFRVVAVVIFLLCLLRPDWTYTRSTTEKPSLLVLLDTSMSMGYDEEGRPDPRLREVLDEMTGQGIVTDLEEGFDLQWFAFDNEARPLEPDQLEELATEGSGKNFARALETGWRYQNLYDFRGDDADQGRNRVLLISDGNDMGLEDPSETARRLGLTVYTLPPRDVPVIELEPKVEISSLQSPGRVMLGSELRFRGRLRSQGDFSGPVEVVLFEDGEPAHTQTVRFDEGTSELRLDLTHMPASEGRKEYELQAVPAGEGIAFEPGRAQSVTVDVAARKDQVLLLEDGWRWDFRYLRQILEDDPNFSLTAFISRQPGIYVQFADPDRTVQLDGFPRSSGELEWFDTIILGDVDPRHWPGGLASAIHDMVVDEGKTLIVLAGPRLSQLAAVADLEKLLPVELAPQGGLTDGPVELEPTPHALASPLFHMPGETPFFESFDDLPTMDQIYAPLRKRPAANLLLQASDQANDFGNLIVLAEHTVGRGRVLYVGTDTLWKWQMRGLPDAQQRTPYEVFWKQALRAMSPQRPAGDRAALWLQTDRSRYAASQPVRLLAQFEGQGLDPSEIHMEAFVRRPGEERELPLTLVAEADQPGSYVAGFEPSEAGFYQIHARASSDGQPLAETSMRIEVEPQPDVLSRRANHEANLSRLAGATGGSMVSMDDRESWPSADPGEIQSVEVERTADLWRNASLLFLLIGVLGLDWLIRLIRGFV